MSIEFDHYTEETVFIAKCHGEIDICKIPFIIIDELKIVGGLQEPGIAFKPNIPENFKILDYKISINEVKV